MNKISLVIEVDDKDVKGAEKSLSNLKSAAKSTGKEGSQSISEFSSSAGGMSAELTQLGSRAQLAAGAVGIAITAIAAAATAASLAAKAIFDLSKAFAEYVREIGDVSKATGIATETISALQFQARRTGADVSVVEKSLSSFTSQLVSTAGTSIKSTEQIDKAFTEAVASISEMEPGIKRVEEATRLFGESGKEILPLIDSFQGDLDGLIETAEKYGFVVGEESVEASGQFLDALKDIELQVEGLKLAFGREFLPEVTKVIRAFGNLLEENRDTFASWATTIATGIKNATNNIRLFLAVAKDLNQYRNTGTFGQNTLLFLDQRNREAQREELDAAIRQNTPMARRWGILPNDSALRAIERNFSAQRGSGRSRRSGGDAVNTLLPSRGFGFTTYNRTGNDQFGTRAAISNLQALARAWADISNVPVQFGDISRRGGGRFAPHRTHRRGDMVDIRPFRRDGRLLPTNVNDPNYDRGATRAFIQLLKQVIPGANVLFNDPVLIREGLTRRARGHDNHLHVNRIGGSVSKELSGIKGFEKFNEQISDQLTAKRREKLLDKYLEIHKLAGLIPGGELLKAFHERLVKEARANKSVQPTVAEARRIFADSVLEAQIKDGTIGPVQSYVTVSDRLTRREELSSEAAELFRLAPELVNEVSGRHLSNVQGQGLTGSDARYQAGIEAIKELNQYEEAYVQHQIKSLSLGQRRVALSIERKHHERLVNAAIEDRKLLQEEEFESLSKQLDIQNRLYSDDQFRKYAQDLSVLREKIALQTDIFELENRIATQGANQAERYKRAWLSAIFEIREANIEAVESQIRSQVRLSDMLEIHNQQIRANVYEHLASQKTLTQAIGDEIIDLYEEIAQKGDELLDRTIGKVPIIGGIAKVFARNSLTQATTSLLDQFFPGASAQFEKLKNPELGELKEHTKLLKSIEFNTSNFGGGGGTANVNFTANVPGAVVTAARTITGGGFNSSAGGGGAGNLVGLISSLFSGSDRDDNPLTRGVTQAGTRFKGAPGLFGAGGRLSPGNLGALFGLAGGLVPGRTGDILGAVGTGLGVTSSLGSILGISALGGPIGLAIGAGVGLVTALFGGLFGSKKKRRDKNEKIPALMQGFSDAMEQFRELIGQVRTLSVDPDQALARGRELRQEIASGFGIQFESKKYRRIARSRINSQLAQIDAKPDGLMQQLIDATSIARAAGDRSQQILPEFAGGFFVRTNGFLGGNWTGRDYIPALLADAEMVLNPAQQAAVIRNAGGRNVFKGAGIPNYEATSDTPAKMNTGGIVNSSGQNLGAKIEVNPNITIVLDGDVFDDRANAYLRSDQGIKTTVKVVKEASRNNEL